MIILGPLGENGLSAQCYVGVMEPKSDLGIATHPVMEAIPAHLRCNPKTKLVTTNHALVGIRLLYYICKNPVMSLSFSANCISFSPAL